MDIAVIRQTEIIDASLFNDLKTAQQFLSMGVWPDADDVQEMPKGYGIGDFYKDGEWEKAPPPPEQPREPLDLPTNGPMAFLQGMYDAAGGVDNA